VVRAHHAVHCQRKPAGECRRGQRHHRRACAGPPKVNSLCTRSKAVTEGFAVEAVRTAELSRGVDTHGIPRVLAVPGGAARYPAVQRMRANRAEYRTVMLAERFGTGTVWRVARGVPIAIASSVVTPPPNGRVSRTAVLSLSSARKRAWLRRACMPCE
jgi:hypothetical protein